MKEILIIGAGPAGLACANELSEANRKIFIVEKDFAVGGFGKTLEFKEGNLTFRTDIGPHRFFSKNKYLYRLIENLLGDDWTVVNRKTRQFIEGKFYDYPINAGQAFRNVGILRSVQMGFSYLSASIQYNIFKKRINNFEDYIVANFGRKLGEFSMLNYTEKIWGIPCKELHSDWAKQRIKGLNIISALKNAVIKKKKESPKSLIENFYYPKYGTGMIYEAIAKKVRSKGNKIITNSFPEKIFYKGNKITKVKLNLNGKIEEFEPPTLVSSLPITDFVRLLSPSPPKEVLWALDKLKWRSQIYVFITLDKEKITDDNWIYFPNKEIPFGRVSEMKNFSSEMSPKEKTSLIAEIFVNEGDNIWKMDEKEIFEMVISQLEKMNLIKRGEIRKYYILKKSKVYPIYDLTYRENLKIIKDFLNQFENLIFIGRPGRFHYTNQDHSLEMGIMAAEGIIENKKYDQDKIGSEEEYFEEGLIKNDKSKR